LVGELFVAFPLHVARPGYIAPVENGNEVFFSLGGGEQVQLFVLL
jgi:hypothetical protein